MWSFCLFIFPFLFELFYFALLAPSISPIPIQLNWLCFLIQLFFFLYVYLINPGYQKGEIDIESDINIKEKYNTFSDSIHFCKICGFLRGRNFHHCKKCGVCLEEFDHHCGVFEKCIGKYNIHAFVIFKIMMGITYVLIIGSFIFYFLSLIKNRYFTQ